MGHTIRTIGDHIGMRYTITAYCTRYLPAKCERVYRGTELDLEALAAKFGPDTDMREIIDRLRCKDCGAPAEARWGHDGRPTR